MFIDSENEMVYVENCLAWIGLIFGRGQCIPISFQFAFAWELCSFMTLSYSSMIQRWIIKTWSPLELSFLTMSYLVLFSMRREFMPNISHWSWNQIEIQEHVYSPMPFNMFNRLNWMCAIRGNVKWPDLFIKLLEIVFWRSIFYLWTFQVRLFQEQKDSVHCPIIFGVNILVIQLAFFSIINQPILLITFMGRTIYLYDVIDWNLCGISSGVNAFKIQNCSVESHLAVNGFQDRLKSINLDGKFISYECFNFKISSAIFSRNQRWSFCWEFIELTAVFPAIYNLKCMK